MCASMVPPRCLALTTVLCLERSSGCMAEGMLWCQPYDSFDASKQTRERGGQPYVDAQVMPRAISYYPRLSSASKPPSDVFAKKPSAPAVPLPSIHIMQCNAPVLIHASPIAIARSFRMDAAALYHHGGIAANRCSTKALPENHPTLAYFLNAETMQ